MARKRITVDDLERMEIDTETGQLFWDGRLVITELILGMPTWAEIAVGVAAIAVVLNYLDIKPKWPWAKKAP